MGMGLACLIVVSGNYALIKELLTKIGGAKDASEVPRTRQDTVPKLVYKYLSNRALIDIL